MQSRIDLKGEINTKGSVIMRTDEDGHKTRFVFDASTLHYNTSEDKTESITFQNHAFLYKKGNDKKQLLYDVQGQSLGICAIAIAYTQIYYVNNHLASIEDAKSKQKIVYGFKRVIAFLITFSEGKVIHQQRYDQDHYRRLTKVSRALDTDKSSSITYRYVGESNLIERSNSPTA